MNFFAFIDSCKVPTASLPWTEKYRPITEVYMINLLSFLGSISYKFILPSDSTIFSFTSG